MTKPHIHILSDGKVVGTVSLDARGHAEDDGTPAAINAIDGLNHGMRREHGKALLDAIVRKLDSSTLVKAEHCSKNDLPKDEVWHKPKEERHSTDPAQTDDWPEWGGKNPDEHHDIQFGDSGHGLVE